MSPQYQKWIDEHPGVYGACVVRCAEMRKAFPELVEVRGFANHCEHVWLTAPDGEIVDPTVAQFGADIVIYIPFKPGDYVRVGRCHECGDAIFAEVYDLNDPKYARSTCDECASPNPQPFAGEP